MKNRYPQEFLDRLAKELGITWTPLKPTTIDSSLIEVRPLPPPSNTLYYCDFKYNENENNFK